MPQTQTMEQSSSSVMPPLRNYINMPTSLAASRQRNQNYNVGNWELLAVASPLQEWRHWLVGAKQPFIIRTDHKNLSYLH